jgi:hypothetical protein
MLKSSPIFKRNGAHLIEKRMFEKNKDCPLSKFECFEHAKTLQVMKTIPKTFMTIQNIMLHLWSFKHTKI